MLKYKCLVLDHDDTVVQSETTVNYPCFCRFLEQYRPGMTISLPEYISDCCQMTFIEMALHTVIHVYCLSNIYNIAFAI